MDDLLYVTMSGAKQNMLAQHIHSNNLANVSTDGFKADLAQARSMQVFGEHFPTRVYSMTERPSSDFTQGPMIETQEPLDLAIKSDGWFSVLDDNGEEAFTRNGNFTVDANGFMRTQEGHILMGNAGPMVLPPFEQVGVAADGTVTLQALGQGPETLVEIDRVKLVNPAIADLVKSEDGLFRRKDGAEELPAAEVQLESGFLEGSNVNAVESMLQILSLARQFEMQVKMMKQAEDMDTASGRLLQSS